MNIPKKVKIGGITYTVAIASKWPGRTEGDYDGECFYSAREGNVIYIGAELSPEAQEVTFIHYPRIFTLHERYNGPRVFRQPSRTALPVFSR